MLASGDTHGAQPHSVGVVGGTRIEHRQVGRPRPPLQGRRRWSAPWNEYRFRTRRVAERWVLSPSSASRLHAKGRAVPTRRTPAGIPTGARGVGMQAARTQSRNRRQRFQREASAVHPDFERGAESRAKCYRAISQLRCSKTSRTASVAAVKRVLRTLARSSWMTRERCPWWPSDRQAEVFRPCNGALGSVVASPSLSPWWSTRPGWAWPV